jgi:pimeloyl-ACP methyl ester carboxylesterase
MPKTMVDDSKQQHWHQLHTLADGRRLGYAEYGDRQGRPVFYFHGFPASRLEARILDDAARKTGIWMIAPERPGYGLSDFQPGRRMLDWPEDVLDLARTLGLERFAILGMSGGGPYALACGWRYPERLDGLVLVGCLGPVYEDWARTSMYWPGRLGFGLGQRAPWLLPVVYGGLTVKVLRHYPEWLQLLMTLARPGADQKVFERPEIRRPLLASLRESLRQGASIAIQEFVLYSHPWGFPLEEVGVAVELWQGIADGVVPVVHAEYFAKVLPNVRPRFIPGEAHFSLPVNYMEEILLSMTGK